MIDYYRDIGNNVSDDSDGKLKLAVAVMAGND